MNYVQPLIFAKKPFPVKESKFEKKKIWLKCKQQF